MADKQYRLLTESEKGMRCPQDCGCVGGCRIASGYYPYPTIPAYTVPPTSLTTEDWRGAIHVAEITAAPKIPEMVKRVEKVISGARIDMARAVIEAMREPTTAMLKAGVAAHETAGQGFLIGAYKAMIDAALKE